MSLLFIHNLLLLLPCTVALVADIMIIKDLGIPRWKREPLATFLFFIIVFFRLALSKCERLLLHHNFPGVYWQIGVVEGPVKFLLSYGLVARVVVRGKVFVGKSFAGSDP